MSARVCYSWIAAPLPPVRTKRGMGFVLRGLSRLLIPLVAAVIGVLLTAWFFPALARQRDDRKRAHELKATLASRIAVLTARELAFYRTALFRKDLLREKYSSRLERPLPEQLRAWTTEAIEIDSALNAYAPGDVVDTWREYASVIARTLDEGFRRPGGDVENLVPEPLRLRFITYPFFQGLQKSLPRSPPPWVKWDWRGIPPTSVRDVVRASRALSRARGRYGVTKRAAPGGQVLFEFHRLVLLELVAEDQLVGRILSSHLSGFSTSRSDLVRDLEPWSS